MITVHHLENSRSHRILWLLEELGVDYDIAFYERDPDSKLAPPELRTIHPLGKSPVITDGDRTVAESAGIIEYLLDEYGSGQLRPEPDTDAFAQYRYWIHYAEGSAMTPLFLRIVFSELPRQAPWPVSSLLKVVSRGVESEVIEPRLATHVDYWEEHLGDSKYFAGADFTAADIQMSVPLEGAAAGVDADKYPAVQALVDRLQQRDAYRAAVESGGGLSMDL